MLVDIDPGTPDPHVSAILRLLEEPTELIRVSRGVYSGGINAGNVFASVLLEKDPYFPWPPIEASIEERMALLREQMAEGERLGWPPASYGVSDSLEQVLERYPCIDADPRPLVV